MQKNLLLDLPSLESHDPKDELQGLSEKQFALKLKQLALDLERKKEAQKSHFQGRLKEAKTKSLMTKYQMIFLKIELYLHNLHRVFKRVEQ